MFEPENGAGILADLEAGERPIPLAELRDEPFMPRPRRGQKLDRATIFRWANAGTRGVKLEVLRTPAGMVSTRAAVFRLFARLSGAAPEQATPARRERHRLRRIDAAERRLATSGL